MPILVKIQLPEGKKHEDLVKCIKDVTQVIMRDLQAEPHEVRVSLTEVPLNRYAVAGIMRSGLKG